MTPSTHQMHQKKCEVSALTILDGLTDEWTDKNKQVRDLPVVVKVHTKPHMWKKKTKKEQK